MFYVCFRYKKPSANSLKNSKKHELLLHDQPKRRGAQNQPQNLKENPLQAPRRRKDARVLNGNCNQERHLNHTRQNLDQEPLQKGEKLVSDMRSPWLPEGHHLQVRVAQNAKFPKLEVLQRGSRKRCVVIVNCRTV
jgi:hypothetical protein